MQEKCDHTSEADDDDDELDSDVVVVEETEVDEKKKNETGKWKSSSSIFSKGSRKGGLATLFRCQFCKKICRKIQWDQMLT